MLANLLEEAFVEDGAAIPVWRGGDRPDYGEIPDGGVAVRAGFESAVPPGLEGSTGLVFAV